MSGSRGWQCRGGGAVDVDSEFTGVPVVLLLAITCDGHFRRALAEREVFAVVHVKSMDEPRAGVERRDAFGVIIESFAWTES